VRRGLKEAQSKDAGRRTGTGYEVWYIRDERARDREVLHLQGGVLYKSGVYASKVTCLTLGGLYGVYGEGMVEILWHRRETSWKTENTKFDLKPPNGLRCRQRHLIAMQKSAEGIVGGTKQTSIFGSMAELGTRLPSKEQEAETLVLNGRR
jgi:hypothetical protein